MTDTPVLLGAYAPPHVRVGARAWCHYRRAWCRVSSFTDAPLVWPRGVQVGIRSGPGVIVTSALVRAIRTESAESLKHWWGVSTKTSWQWRRRFVPGPGHVRTRGDVIVQRRLSAAGADATRGVPLSADACDARSAAAKAAGRKPPGRWKGRGWTAEQEALLGTMPDAEVAARIGRTVEAVRCRRTAAGIPPQPDRQRKQVGRLPG
ncbi:MAG: hypothetical protein U0804_16085 [Gemmataceae bacterium]